MVKNMKRVVKKAPKKKTKQPVRRAPVSVMTTAPVSIGNSIRGQKPKVVNTPNGARVVGRDFCFEAKATVAAVNGWTLIGGMPITPSVLATAGLRGYTQMFSCFKVNRLAVHYITSSPTSQSGDVLFYYERERTTPMIDFTNNSFLPFVLSDPNTILGPQWQNHTAFIDPIKEWKTTNYGLNPDLNEDATGSVFLFSKTSAANSPGYIIFDYDIEFKEMCVNPRAGVLPVSRGLWNYATTQVTALAATAGTTIPVLILAGNNPDGVATAMPNGAASGDIYKMIALITASTASGVNSAWTNATTANLFSNQVAGGSDNAITIDDGYTVYGVWNGTSFYIYQTLEGAKFGPASNSSTNLITYGVNATVTFSICWMISQVASVGGNLQSSY